MIDKSPILITGIPRSGASMIAGVLNICGAFCGDVSLHKGSFENGGIMRMIEGSFLQSIGCDPMGQYPLPERIDYIPVGWHKLVVTQMISEGYKGGPWFYKSSRASLLWRIWHNAFPNAKWVIVRRRTGDVIQSCLKTGYMKAFKDENIRRKVGVNSESEGWLWMVHEYEKRFVEMIEEGLNCKIIWPERMVYGDYGQLYELLEWVGLKWKSEVLSFIDPLLDKSRQRKGGEGDGK